VARARAGFPTPQPQGNPLASSRCEALGQLGQDKPASTVGTATPFSVRHPTKAGGVAGGRGRGRDGGGSRFIGAKDSAHCAPGAAWSGQRLRCEPPESSQEEPPGEFSQLSLMTLGVCLLKRAVLQGSDGGAEAVAAPPPKPRKPLTRGQW